MLTVSDEFLAAIRAPHMLATLAVVTPPTGSPFTLDVTDGSVTIDRTADQRRQLALTVSDPTLYPAVSTDPLAPYGSEITIWRGVEYANGATDLVQLGIFRIQDVARDIPGGALTLTGLDRSAALIDDRLLKPRAFAKQSATSLIQLLITEVYPDAVFNITTADTTRIKRHVVDRDRWSEIQRVAQVIGCEVFADAYGVWVIQDVPDPTTETPVWTVDAGTNGVLIQATDTVTRDSVPNGVVAIGDGPPTVFVADGWARSLGSGWGTSGSGDTWNIVTGSAGDFDTNSSLGRIQAAAGDVKRAQVPIDDDADTDATVTITYPHTITGGDLQASLGLRANNTGLTAIRINATYDQATGHIFGEPQKIVSGGVSSLGSPKDLGAYNAGDDINVRLRLVGINVKAKAWNSNEPKHWDWVTTQSDVSGLGDLQLRLERTSGNTNSGTPQVTFDNLTATATGTWYGIAHDDNPLSATYWLGDYGQVPVFYTHPHIRTQAQADRIARRKLNDHLGESRTISFGSIVNPAIDAGDAVTIIRPDGTTEVHLIDTIDIPLSPDGVMTAATRAPEWVGAA